MHEVTQENQGEAGPARHIFVWRTFRGVPFQHHGVCLGDGTVVHYADREGRAAGPGGGRGAFRISRTSMEVFSPEGEQMVHEVQHRGRLPETQIRRRALHGVGREGIVSGGYHLLAQNCEHFAAWCVTGQFESEQVRVASRRGVSAGTKWALIAAGKTLRHGGMRHGGTIKAVVAQRSLRGVSPWLMAADVVQWGTETLGHHAGLHDPKQRKWAGRVLGGGTAAVVGAAGGPVGMALAAGSWLASESVASGVTRYWAQRKS